MDFPLANAAPEPMFARLMNSEIEKAIEAGKLTSAAGAALEKLQPGTYVLHKSWGFGQIGSINFLVNQITINFKGRKGHAMQLQYAADSLQPIEIGRASCRARM